MNTYKIVGDLGDYQILELFGQYRLSKKHFKTTEAAQRAIDKKMDFQTLTEIAIYLVCDGKNPHSRDVDYETYAQLTNQLNEDFRSK